MGCVQIKRSYYSFVYFGSKWDRLANWTYFTFRISSESLELENDPIFSLSSARCTFRINTLP